MANSIALAKTYLPLLDEVYKASSKSAILDSASTQIRFLGGNKAEIFKTSMAGLGNYSRSTGFVAGDVTATWEELTLTQDRGRSFSIDSMDDEETIGMAFGTLAGEFLRTQVVPEVDAYRFATYASGAALGAEGATPSIDAITAAEVALGDAEVPNEGRILFISESMYGTLKGEVNRVIVNEESGVNRAIEYFDGMQVVTVPVGRFNTAVTLKDGSTSGQTDGGYTASGKAINFMIVHPSAVWQTIKHESPRIFAPDVNQSADAWLFQYRVYHDCGVLENKTNGIYLHKAV